MEELFGLSMNVLLIVLLAIFLGILAVVVFMAWRNRIMLKLGLRNIPRRRAQTVLIIVGSMLSAILIASAFGTGDTISFSIRNDTLEALGPIDELLTSTGDSGRFGVDTPAYMPRSRFDEIRQELAGFDAIDGMVPYIGETVAALNLRTSLTEGQTRVTAVDPDLLQGFGDFTLVAGGQAFLGDLPEEGVFINDKAAEELDAQIGDQVRLFLEERAVDYRVEGVVEQGGLAGVDSTVLLPLARGQDLFDRSGQINSIAVSNRGEASEGVDLSEEVTRRLRVLLADPLVAEELRVLLGRQEVLTLLEERQASLSGALQSNMGQLSQELRRLRVTEELIRVLADRDVAIEVVDVLGDAQLTELEAEADTLLFIDLAAIRVIELKRFLLDVADDAASGVTTFFITIGLFSIMVGILLIFLIFVMLAAARRTEMGMTRAVGAKRSHLVQMFVFEGTAYDLAAATVGTLIGLLLSLGLVAIFNHLLAGIDDDFSFSYHLEPRSAIVAFCLGMIVVFVTASVSAYRVSRMNIAEAVRGLPEIMVLRGEASFTQRFLLVPKALVQPFIFLGRAFQNLVSGRFSQFWLALGGAVLWIPLLPVWWVGLVIALVRFAWPYFRRGWLTLLLGLLLLYVGAGPLNQVAPFTIGISLMIVGVGLMLRLLISRMPALTEAFGILVMASGLILAPHGAVTGDIVPIVVGAVVAAIGVSMTMPLILRRTERRTEVIDRLAFTFIGVVMLALWVLPFDTMTPLTGELDGGAEMFFVSGILMVAAAVWTVMYNADLLLGAITALTSRIGKLRPVLVTAVAYPMNAKFRTGLTLAMFSLVVFTLIVMSLVNDAFRNVFSDTDRVTGQWDIEGFVSPTNPIGDIGSAIEENPELSLADFEAIGGYVKAPISIRQVAAQSQVFESWSLQASSDEYLEAARYDFKILADGYSTKQEVWQALRSDPSLAVIDGAAVAGDDGFGGSSGSFRLQGVSIDDESMAPVAIEVLEPRTGTQLSFTIIGVLDTAVDATGVITSKSSVDEAFPFSIPLNTYRFRMTEGVDPKSASRKLEAAFLVNGMETAVLEEDLADVVSFITSFYNLLTAYMGLGLVVGIAALGVITMRAVVERRQQIGVLRAIGYRRGMIQLSFLLESSFVALLGVALGVALGTIISYNLVSNLETELEGIRFTVPWIQILVIVALAYIFSMLATILPARQASGTTPAEALRYE